MSGQRTVPSGEASIAGLVNAIRRVLESVSSRDTFLQPTIDLVLQNTRYLPLTAELLVSNNKAALGHLQNALYEGASGPAAAVVRALQPVALHLPWRYSYTNGDTSLASRIAFAEVVGPEGPLASDHVRLGFTLIGPETYYPLHAHPAVELYYVVTGRSWWTAGDTTTERFPGSSILHPSEIAHATRTEGETMLAVYAWVGDIMAPSRYL